MINLQGTVWKLSTNNESLSDKMINLIDSSNLIFDKKEKGTYLINGDKIELNIFNCNFKGVIVEDFIFGVVNIGKESIDFECTCNSYDPLNVYMKEFQKINVGDDDDFFLIHDIYKLIKDYRIEYSDGSRISRSRIKTWIDQFDEIDRIPILTELKSIFIKRYYSKKTILSFLDGDVIQKLAKELGFSDVKDFLLNSQFVDIQNTGKSQGKMLELFDELISLKYNIALKNCGSKSRTYSIYFDDVLCTGLTLINDLKKWSSQPFSDEKTNLQAVNEGTTTLICAYSLAHDKNYHKKVSEMKHKISATFANKIRCFAIWIDNNINKYSKAEFVIPTEENLSQEILSYKDTIIKEVDIYTAQYNSISPEEFFRPFDVPQKEELFTSNVNRNILEKAFLKKGIEILDKSNVSNKNMRALGYSIPSHKNFGFGALCFTWRNIPNNTPLVFWYSGGGFTPLFDVRKSNSSVLVDFANFVVQ